MKNALPVILLAMVQGACTYLGEGAKGVYGASYSEVKNAIKNHKPLSPEELDQRFAECPRPNGVFEAAPTNERTKENKGGFLLDGYFVVSGFQSPATNYRGGRKWDEPVPTSVSPINILGGVKDGVRQSYRVSMNPPEQFTLELRPLRPGRFRIGVTSITLGRSGEAEGYLNLRPLGLRAHCESGILKVFRKEGDKTILSSELSVEAATGDIVVSRGSDLERGEITLRFRKIGD